MCRGAKGRGTARQSQREAEGGERERSSARPMAEGECGGVRRHQWAAWERKGRAGQRHSAGGAAGAGMGCAELPRPPRAAPGRTGAPVRAFPHAMGRGQRHAGRCCCRHYSHRETGSPASGTLVAGAGTRPGWGTAAGSPSLLRVEGAEE